MVTTFSKIPSDDISRIEKLYSNVSSDLRIPFQEFRARNLYSEIEINKVKWNYISCGRGRESILFLTGGSSIGDGWAFHIMGFENDYRCITIDYPAISDMRELIKGITVILKVEGIDKVHIIGQSFGGIIGPCFVYHHPNKVDKMILAHTFANLESFSQSERDKRIKRLERSVKIFRLIPGRLFRRVSLKRMSKHFIDLDNKNAEFLKAFFTEVINYRITKKHVISTSLVMIDYLRNHILSAKDFKDWAGKVFIFESESDKAIKAEEKQAVKSLFKNVKVHTFEGEDTSHLSIFSKREEFLILVKEFLSNHKDFQG